MSTLARPYLVFNQHPDGWVHVYVHVATGQGRSTRRRLIEAVWVRGPLTREGLPDVLRRAALQLELDLGLRDTPGGGGPGSPWGAVGGEPPG